MSEIQPSDDNNQWTPLFSDGELDMAIFNDSLRAVTDIEKKFTQIDNLIALRHKHAAKREAIGVNTVIFDKLPDDEIGNKRYETTLKRTNVGNSVIDVFLVVEIRDNRSGKFEAVRGIRVVRWSTQTRAMEKTDNGFGHEQAATIIEQLEELERGVLDGSLPRLTDNLAEIDLAEPPTPETVRRAIGRRVQLPKPDID